MKFFKVNPDEANYYASHIQLTCRLSCGLAKEMGLANPQAIKKLVFTSYLHDISLIKNPKLAEINTKSKFNKMKNSLTKEDIDLILKHHEDSSEISLKFQGIPLEVDSIIKQHHNIEDGITSVKSAGEIPLFSAIFIISHDLSDYIFLNKKWTIEDFIFEKKSIYSKGNLLRVLKEMDRKED
jgi:response regulator RpfG family c-di-GMP phosphodiesterase